MPAPNTASNAAFANDSIPRDKLTPMLRQYVELKAERPDAALLMRVVDFYEAYGEDTETMSRELEISLTGHEVPGLADRFPMAGRHLVRSIGTRSPVTGRNYGTAHSKMIVQRRIRSLVVPGKGTGVN